MELVVMDLDNDTRGWIMSIVSGIGTCPRPCPSCVYADGAVWA